MRVVLASTFLMLAAAVGCGGRVTGGPQDDSEAGGDDGGPVEDAVTVDTYAPVFDAELPTEDAPIVVVDAGSCLVDLEPCIDSLQCCSGLCAGGTCQGDVPPPSCLPDGDACNGSQPCCSGPCINGLCGVVVDAGPPVTCSAPAGNQCLGCLAGACCAELGSCEADSLCSQTLACFEGCFTPGSGNACATKCYQQYPSPLSVSLQSCAVNQCGPSCQ